MEHWNHIKGYVGLYQVSDKGIIKSLPRKFTHKDEIIVFLELAAEWFFMR